MKAPASTTNPATADDDALEQELRALGDIPEPWLAVGEGRVAPEAAFPGDPALREQLAPLDPSARARMAAHALATLAAPAAAPATPRADNVVPLAPRRARWLAWTAPLVAAAAVLLLVFWPGGPALDGTGAAEVRVFSALRGDEAGGTELRVAGGEHFYLECRGDDSLEIVAVRATKVGAPADPRLLGGKPAPQADRGETLHVLADLGRGAWDVTCGARHLKSGQFVWLGPPARIHVE
ncbi:hypothetical protein [Nannocystis bainbridge]|uniref:Cupredoxin-like domain-containing protein n=1 Tax=Nannocystis bainbridge TaxID=2995303 RepID=A0ABT5EEP0_9BACT|nr:hypothetical protein [Nannocystis bainbridge]MDC0723301.1 hypothetical protein [Nannocystis bainbridge]